MDWLFSLALSEADLIGFNGSRQRALAQFYLVKPGTENVTLTIELSCPKRQCYQFLKCPSEEKRALRGSLAEGT
jgi:hypothetical protein